MISFWLEVVGITVGLFFFLIFLPLWIIEFKKIRSERKKAGVSGMASKLFSVAF